jgi:hypothetical protein
MAEITEWTFAADAAKWMTLYLQGRRHLPFTEAKVEIKGKGGSTRRDLVLYDRDVHKALTAEIKLPDTKEGQTPFNARLVTDARRKAAQSRAPFFATWNVNRLVLWPTRGEHELKVYDAVSIRARGELAMAQVQRRLAEEFIPRFLEDYARLYRGEEALGALPLDQRFIRRLESALESLASVVFSEALERYSSNRQFKQGLDAWMREQEWLLSDDEELVRENVDRAIRLACYITANKLVFYQALRRTRTFKLRKLSVPAHVDSGERLRDHFAALFHEAKAVTHDYQTIFEGGFIDRVPFLTDQAVERWRALVGLLNEFDFRQFGQDVIGHIFEDLLGPEERHRWGQHYTKPEVVDLINAFCIREADAIVLDPASGSGTFPVRAYARKKHLARGALSHAELLSQLYACEISEYAAHLTALNLATRDLIDGENFPRVARADFFDTGRDKPFCSVPDVLAERKKRGGVAMRDIALQRVDAVIGNPPYLRQEEIGKANKQNYGQLAQKGWPGLKLSGRSDLHVYFWPHASVLLAEGGHFGFLTSSSWLDVEYGFPLQRWILQNFELVAVLESGCEPWFTGARVATAATILRRCSDPAKRATNLVRFVQLRKPLKDLLANDGTESGRQEAAERFRDLIEGTTGDTRTADYRILVVRQQKLWEEGCNTYEGVEENEADESQEKKAPEVVQGALHEDCSSRYTVREYHGGKWGVYLRAPDLYFEIMAKYGLRLVPLGQIATIRRGVTSGCDDFFMPMDISGDALAQELDSSGFRRRFHCNRADVASGKVSIVRAGDGSEHPVETEYLVAEVQSLMFIESALISRVSIKHRLLVVSKPLEALKGTHVLTYLRFGQRESFGGTTPVPKRPTCASRPRWYDLTNYSRGSIILPKLVKYRHIAPWNGEKLPVNCALMVVEAKDTRRNRALAAVLNSTLLALIRPYFSRHVGTEAHTQLDVYAANVLPVPDVNALSARSVERLTAAFEALSNRPVSHLVEQRLLDVQNLSELKDRQLEPKCLPLELQRTDRQALDLEVLRALGVPEQAVAGLRDRLYLEVTRFFNEGRFIELQANENRKRAKKGRVAGPREIADEILDSIEPGFLNRFPDDFLPTDDTLETVELPEGKATIYPPDDFYDSKSLLIGRQKLTFGHRAQAELAKLHCDLEKRGFVKLPISEEGCVRVTSAWNSYAREMRQRFEPLAAERTEDPERLEAILAELQRLLALR